MMKHSALTAQRIFALLLSLTLLLSVFCGPGASGTASYQEKIGVITASPTLNVRNEPSTSGAILGSLDTDAMVAVIGEERGTDRAVWYQIRYGDGVGYVRSDYVCILDGGAGGSGSDAAFEAMIAGFPESYKTGLRGLHVLYPSWVFEPVNTGTNWEDALEAECVLGISLIATGSISSWKSTQSGAYDWTTGKWTGLDGAPWVQASRAITAYYLDPRNYLSVGSVFAFLDYTYDSERQTREGLERMIAGSFLAGEFSDGTEGEEGEEAEETIYQYADVIMEAAEQYKMNPYILATTMRTELGNEGKSNSISGTLTGYEGYYNYYNIGAYATGGMGAIERGLWYARGGSDNSTTYGRPWNTRYRAILGGAQFFAETYAGAGQYTLYLKKFNVISGGTYKLYTHQYMTNVQGAETEGRVLAQAYDEQARSEELIFKIPVFNNMPEAACLKPTGTGSPNNKLAALSVDDFSLTPAFHRDTLSYGVVVPGDTAQITIKATALDATAKIAGTGTFPLAVGVNEFEVVVTAGNGDTRTYELSIAREKPASAAEPELHTIYTVSEEDRTLHGLTAVPTAAADFIEALGVTDGTAEVLTADGQVQAGNVGTGTLVRIRDLAGEICGEYTVIVYGDANGDGRFTATDSLLIQRHALGLAQLSDVYLTAADANHDGRITAIDPLQIQRTALGLADIQQ